ncbi:MAG: stalk domain-containing protein [Defluviitaleaceae bacterium]|nr:stalk domain-containing protein [Defluviitaleaceae bacterium]
MMRKIITSIAALVITFAVFSVCSLSASEVNVTIFGESVNFGGQDPIIIDGRTLVPVRGVFEHLGFDVDWNQAAQTATLTDNNSVIVITVGSQTFTTNGHIHTLDAPAQIFDGRTLIPIRAVVESIGLEASWDSAMNTVIIRYIVNGPTLEIGDDDILPPFVTTLPDAAQLTETEAFEQRIFELVNIERANNGVPPLIWHDGLAASARAHSADMARNNNFSHSSSDGTSFSARMAALGIPNMGIAENILAGGQTPEAMMTGWMNSEGHRGNILDPNLTHIGIGFYHLPDSEWTYYATQKFMNIR